MTPPFAPCSESPLAIHISQRRSAPLYLRGLLRAATQLLLKLRSTTLRTRPRESEMLSCLCTSGRTAYLELRSCADGLKQADEDS